MAETKLMQNLKEAKAFYEGFREEYLKMKDLLSETKKESKDIIKRVGDIRTELSEIDSEALKAEANVKDLQEAMVSLRKELSNFDNQKKLLEEFESDVISCRDSFNKVRQELRLFFNSSDTESLEKLISIISKTRGFDLKSFENHLNQVRDFDKSIGDRLASMNNLLLALDSENKNLKIAQQNFEQEFNQAEEAINNKVKEFFEKLSKETLELECKKRASEETIQAQLSKSDKHSHRSKLWALICLVSLAANLAVAFLW